MPIESKSQALHGRLQRFKALHIVTFFWAASIVKAVLRLARLGADTKGHGLLLCKDKPANSLQSIIGMASKYRDVFTQGKDYLRIGLSANLGFGT